MLARSTYGAKFLNIVPSLYFHPAIPASQPAAVIGNLISNTVLVVVGLSHSLYIAVGSLLFLIVIHKLEYFLNAKIIDSHINAKVWELLTAMLAMEALFGIPGMISAPVLYAYAKRELSEYRLV